MSFRVQLACDMNCFYSVWLMNSTFTPEDYFLSSLEYSDVFLLRMFPPAFLSLSLSGIQSHQEFPFQAGDCVRRPHQAG